MLGNLFHGLFCRTPARNPLPRETARFVKYLVPEHPLIYPMQGLDNPFYGQTFFAVF